MSSVYVFCPRVKNKGIEVATCTTIIIQYNHDSLIYFIITLQLLDSKKLGTRTTNYIFRFIYG